MKNIEQKEVMDFLKQELKMVKDKETKKYLKQTIDYLKNKERDRLNEKINMLGLVLRVKQVDFRILTSNWKSAS